MLIVTNPDGQSARANFTYDGANQNAYFDMLLARQEFYRAWSLRNQAEVNSLQAWGDDGWWKVNPSVDAVELLMPQMRRYEECTLVYGQCEVKGAPNAIIPKGTIAINPNTGFTYQCAAQYTIPSTGINLKVRFDALNPNNHTAKLSGGTSLVLPNPPLNIDPNIKIATKYPIAPKCSDSLPTGNQLRMPVGIEDGIMFLTWDFFFSENWRTSAAKLSAFKNFKIQSGSGTNIMGGWWTMLNQLSRKSQTDTRTIGTHHEGIALDDGAQGITAGKPLAPTNAYPSNTFQIFHSVWTRFWIELKLNQPSEAFVEWNNRYNGGVPIAPNTNNPDGFWHMMSFWIGDSIRPPTAVGYRIPIYGDGGDIIRFDFEFNTSDIAPARTGPFTGFGRNVSILKGLDLPDNAPVNAPEFFPTPA